MVASWNICFNMVASWNIFYETYSLLPDGVGKAGMYADGKPHHLLYKRSKSEMILTVSIVYDCN